MHQLQIIDLITLGVVDNFTSSFIAAFGRYLENPLPYPPLLLHLNYITYTWEEFSLSCTNLSSAKKLS